MTIWIETIANGLFLGGLYALIGLGLGFTFGVMKIVNIAQGDFIVAASFVGVLLVPFVPLHPMLVILPVACLAVVFGMGLQSVLINRVIGKGPVPQVLLTFGLAIILRNTLLAIYGADNKAIDPGPIRFEGFDLFGLRLGVFPALILAIALALFLGLHWWLHHTRYGRIVRATADDHEIVQVLGVDYRRVYSVAAGIALALASVAGLLLAMRSSFSAFSGVDRLLIAFEVVIIGGMGSLRAMFLGGLLLGVVQLVALKLNPTAGLMYGHIVFFVILITSPQGLPGLFKR